MQAPFKIAVILIALLLICKGAGMAQQGRSSIDSLRREAAKALRVSDSLRSAWDVQWKQSDSLRIESMFLRMRSDSLKRVVQTQLGRVASLEQAMLDTTSTMDVIVDSAVVNTIRSAAQAVRKPKVSSGRTLSDSVTAIVMKVKPDTGTASYYAEQFHGKKTSSGETFNMHDRTCAHRWLPFNTMVKVTNLANGKEVVVRVTDRGPWKHTRLIDVSKQAAKELDMIRAGTARVAIEVVDPPSKDEESADDSE